MKGFKRTTFLLALTLICTMCIGSGYSKMELAINADAALFHQTETLHSQIYFGKIKNVLNTYAKQYFSEDKTISIIKELTDFSGNKYTLAEFAPTGYFIYHNEAGRVVERSEEDISPYLGKNGRLFYAGPTYYYYQSEGKYIHTVLPNETIMIDAETQSVCDSQYQSVKSYKNKEVLSYLKDETQPVATDLSGEIVPYARTDTASVAHPEFFTNMYDCGYVLMGNGICGYIAGAMLLSYYDTYKFSFLEQQHKPVVTGTSVTVQTSLTRELRSIGAAMGKGNGTVSGDIRDVCRSYLESHGRTGLNHESYWLSFYNGEAAFFDIQEDKPVIVFGSLKSPQTGAKKDHAATVYRATAEKTTLVGPWHYVLYAHFGWPSGYRNVAIEGIVASWYLINN